MVLIGNGNSNGNMVLVPSVLWLIQSARMFQTVNDGKSSYLELHFERANEIPLIIFSNAIGNRFENLASLASVDLSYDVH